MHISKEAERAVSDEWWRIPADIRLELLAFLSTDPTVTATMTYEEFLDWATEDTLAEWVDGRVVMTSPAGKRHQDLAKFIADLFAAYAATHDLGTVLMAPFQMRLPMSGREPDVIYVANEHRERVRLTRIDGPADLAVEIISPESRARDRGEKFYEYESGGVGEYWLIDPDTRRAEFYQLDAEGAYQVILPDDDGMYRSRTLQGFWLRVEWLWQDPLPPVNRTMLAIAGEAYASQMLAELRDGGFLPG